MGVGVAELCHKPTSFGAVPSWPGGTVAGAIGGILAWTCLVSVDTVRRTRTADTLLS
jgi:hypothetical protein